MCWWQRGKQVVELSVQTWRCRLISGMGDLACVILATGYWILKICEKHQWREVFNFGEGDGMVQKLNRQKCRAQADSMLAMVGHLKRILWIEQEGLQMRQMKVLVLLLVWHGKILWHCFASLNTVDCGRAGRIYPSYTSYLLSSSSGSSCGQVVLTISFAAFSILYCSSIIVNPIKKVRGVRIYLLAGT